MELTYERYDDKTLIVFGDRDTYKRHINLLGGRWNSKKNAWFVPISNENKLENLIGEKIYHREDSDNDEEYLEDETRREEVINEHPPMETQELDLNEKRLLEYRKREEENRIRERRKREELKKREEEMKINAKNKYIKQDPMVYNRSFKHEEDDPYELYKSFNKKPIEFKRNNNIESESESDSASESDVESSSDDEDSESSSDGFPSPSTPRKRNSYARDEGRSYNELYSKVKDLHRRVAEMEITNRRRK
jgi:hypothetical protein